MAVSLHTTRSHIYSLLLLYLIADFTKLNIFAKPVFDCFIVLCFIFHYSHYPLEVNCKYIFFYFIIIIILCCEFIIQDLNSSCLWINIPKVYYDTYVFGLIHLTFFLLWLHLVIITYNPKFRLLFFFTYVTIQPITLVKFK